jgi:hypothetical protein
MINKVTPRKRNSETDKRLVAPDQYTDAVNIRVENSFSESGQNSSGNVGVVKPVKGNTPATLEGIDGDQGMAGYKILGRVLDTPTNCLYFAAANADAALNGVFKVDPATNAISPVLQTAYFAWNGLANVDMCLARSKDDNVLIYMTDGINAPYKIDIAFHENNTAVTGERLYDAITVCQKTPNNPVVASFTSVQSNPSNFKRINGVQFAYQNIYETGEISAVSSYSSLIVPPPYLNQGSGDLSQLDAYNAISVTIPAQPASVEKVRLLVRFGESDPFYVIDEFDSSGDVISNTFTNNEVLNTLPEKESNRLFDAVPIKALTNEIQEDRLFYGNYTEGRYNTQTKESDATTTATLTVNYAERPNDFQSLEIDVEPMVLRMDKSEELGDAVDGYCKNRMAGFSIKLRGGVVEETIAAGSVFAFDLTFQPDKNWHLYESSSSFHSNNELYGFDAADSGEIGHKFASNFNFNYLSNQSDFGGSNNSQGVTNSEYYWSRSCYGFPNQSPGNGSPNGSPRRALSDALFGDEAPATWTPRSGPYRNQPMECIYGSSPANPVILRGGDIYFSVRFRTLSDLTASAALQRLTAILSEQDPDQTGVLADVEILRQETRGGYQIDLGVGQNAKKRFSRSSNFSDLVCHVGLKTVQGDSNSSYLDDNILDGNAGAMNACGYFAVNKADLQFRLRDLSAVAPHTSIGGSSDGNTESYFLAIDLSSIKNVEVVTCVPVFEHFVTGGTWQASFNYPPFNARYSGSTSTTRLAPLRYKVALGVTNTGDDEDTSYINNNDRHQYDGLPTLGNGIWENQSASQTQLVGGTQGTDAMHVLNHMTTVEAWVAHGSAITTSQDFRLNEGEARNLFSPAFENYGDTIGTVGVGTENQEDIANVYQIMANWGLNNFNGPYLESQPLGIGDLEAQGDLGTAGLSHVQHMLMWFGVLTPAGGAIVDDDDDDDGGVSGGTRPSGRLTESTPLFRTYDDYVDKATELGYFDDSTGALFGSAQSFVNFSSSMVDGEGGIGGWKGSLSQTAKAFAPLAQERAYFNPGVGNSNWGAFYTQYQNQGLDPRQQPQLSFTDAEIDEAFRKFTGKIEGSVPSSIVLNGTWGFGVRIVVDTYLRDTGSTYESPLGDSNQSLQDFLSFVYAAQSNSELLSSYSEQPYYPPGKIFGGPTLLGFHFPFQYLFPGVLRPTKRMESTVDNCTLLGKSNGSQEDLADFVLNIVSGYSQLGNYDIDNGVSRLLPTVPGYLAINSEDSLQDERPSSVEVLSENTFVIQGDANQDSYKSFKRYANHNLGILYYDYFGRPGSVIPFDPVYVGGYGQDTNNGVTSINVTFGTSAPPDWAHSYRFVYGGNTSIGDFVQYTAGGAFVGYKAFDGTTEETDGNIYVSLNYLQENSEVSYTKAFGAVSNANEDFLYRYSPGDKLRIISYFDGDDIDTRQFPINYEFDVLDVVTIANNDSNPIHNPNNGAVPKFKQGQFLVLRNNPLASGFTYGSVKAGGNAPETTAHKWNNRAVFELYSPRALRDSDEILYREVGPAFDIVTQQVEGANVATHEAASHTVTDGDVWFRSTALNMPPIQGQQFANIIQESGASSPRFRDYFVESYRFTDTFPNTKVSGKGKPFIYSPDARELNKSSSIIFSDLNPRSSKYNRFSTFDATTANFKNVPNDHGSIQMIMKDGDSLATFQESKMSMLPVNRSVLSDASNSATLLASAQTIGNQVFVPGSYGVGTNPESVLYVDGFMYFANPKRKEVYRYAPSRGVEVISDSGMRDYFEDLFKEANETSKVVSGFDYQNSEYLIDFVPQDSQITYSNPPTYPTLPAGTPPAEGERLEKGLIPPLVITRRKGKNKKTIYSTKPTSFKRVTKSASNTLSKLAGNVVPSVRRANSRRSSY